MPPAQKNSSPLSYVEVAERKRLNIACEQGVPSKKWGAIVANRNGAQSVRTTEQR